MKYVMTILMAGLFTTTAFAQIKNFKSVDVTEFTCAEPFRGKPNIAGIEWNAEGNQAIVITKNETNGVTVLEDQVFDIESIRSGLLTQWYFGRPADGSKGSLQIMLRHERPTTVILNSKGVSYTKCELEYSFN